MGFGLGEKLLVMAVELLSLAVAGRTREVGRWFRSVLVCPVPIGIHYGPGQVLII